MCEDEVSLEKDKSFFREKAEKILKSLQVNDNVSGLPGDLAEFLQQFIEYQKEFDIQAEREKELRVINTELSKAVCLKDEFLASMSHELRTPLNAILGMVEAMLDQVYGSINEQQAKSLKTIDESGRHLLSLINDILDLSKIEVGKMDVDLEVANIHDICESSVRMLREAAQRKQIQVIYNSDIPLDYMKCDARRMKQVLVNLLSNAVKFTLNGGRVGLDVFKGIEKDVIYFSVWDTGIGIAKEHMDKLFQPYQQVDSSLARQYNGTGLGLYLVQKMIEMHGGSITVESEENKGSRFTVSLPIDQ